VAGLKVKKGDRVRVLQGKDRGKEGEVSRVIPETGKVIVDGLNVVKKHQRATRATMQGGIIDKEMPIPASNVAVIAADGKPTKVGFRFDDKGNKVRIARRTGEDI
jgi:large subunit ribosomal protein L24